MVVALAGIALLAGYSIAFIIGCRIPGHREAGMVGTLVVAP